MVHVCQLLHFLSLYICLVSPPSSLSLLFLPLLLLPPLPIILSSSFCNNLIPLTDVCLFQIPFSIKVQPQHSLLLPSLHLFLPQFSHLLKCFLLFLSHLPTQVFASHFNLFEPFYFLLSVCVLISSLHLTSPLPFVYLYLALFLSLPHFLVCLSSC